MTFNPFTGTVPEYLQALGEHHLGCAVCAPHGLPKTNDGLLCEKGRRIRWGLQTARERHR